MILRMWGATYSLKEVYSPIGLKAIVYEAVRSIRSALYRNGSYRFSLGSKLEISAMASSALLRRQANLDLSKCFIELYNCVFASKVCFVLWKFRLNSGSYYR